MIYESEALNAMAHGIAARLNEGANSTLAIYAGDILAAEIVLTNPAEQSIVGGVITFKVPPQVIAVASGVPTTAKILTAAGATIATLDAATELVLDKDKIYMGGYVGLTSMTLQVTA
ncbi:hypothetical protein CAP50_05845 [Psychrobacter sp. L7]|uniref:hypothetical protein n=1 Tax=Psychrobacter sp. L7 TaxID=1982756 RepID=UPI000C2AA34F|nr:hypothetical protein [Psychrobacter sp. L7]PJX25073.1 hypothetical protein CAP50_05845 [Psychrobacter sp. L7]